MASYKSSLYSRSINHALIRRGLRQTFVTILYRKNQIRRSRRSDVSHSSRCRGGVGARKDKTVGEPRTVDLGIDRDGDTGVAERRFDAPARNSHSNKQSVRAPKELFCRTFVTNRAFVLGAAADIGRNCVYADGKTSSRDVQLGPT